MQLDQDTKLDIQTFVYFLFKGTLDQRLIFLEVDYLDILTNKPSILYNCFEIFANHTQNSNTSIAKEHVVEYIVDVSTRDKSASFTNKSDELKISHFKANPFWKDFLELARRFCFLEFEIPLNSFDLRGLNGNGADAVPYFAIWTNVIELDEDGNIKNSEFALRRANERLKLWDDAQSYIFSEDELEQEIY